MYSLEDFQHDLIQLQEHIFNFYRLEPIPVNFKNPVFYQYPVIQTAPCSLQELHHYKKEQILPHTKHNGRTFYRLNTDDYAFWAPFMLEHIWFNPDRTFDREKQTLIKGLKHFPLAIMEHSNNPNVLPYVSYMSLDFDTIMQEDHYPHTKKLLLIYKMKECLPLLSSIAPMLFESQDAQLWDTLINMNKNHHTTHKSLINNLSIFYTWKQQLIQHGIPHKNTFFDPLYDRLQNPKPIQNTEEFPILHPYFSYPLKNREVFQYMYQHIEIWHAFIHQHNFGPTVIKTWCDRNTNITLTPEQMTSFKEWWAHCSEPQHVYWKRYILTYMNMKKTRKEICPLLCVVGLPMRKNHFLSAIHDYLTEYNVVSFVEEARQHAHNLTALGHIFTRKKDLMLQYCIDQIGHPIQEESLYL